MALGDSADDTLPASVVATAAARAELPVVARSCYEVLSEHARGGLGRILRARDLRTGRLVATARDVTALEQTQAALTEATRATLHDAIRGERGSRYYLKTDRKTRCSTVNYDGMHLDVTPARLITAIITERGVARPDYQVALPSLFAAPDR